MHKVWSRTRRGVGVWKVLWVAVIWKVWKHINKAIFRQGKMDDVEIFSLAQLNA